MLFSSLFFHLSGVKSFYTFFSFFFFHSVFVPFFHRMHMIWNTNIIFWGLHRVCLMFHENWRACMGNLMFYVKAFFRLFIFLFFFFFSIFFWPFWHSPCDFFFKRGKRAGFKDYCIFIIAYSFMSWYFYTLLEYFFRLNDRKSGKDNVTPIATFPEWK